MLIGVDGNEANVKEKVGVSWYVFNLLKEFALKANSKTRFKIFLKDKPDSSLPAESAYFKYFIVKAKFLWSQIFLPLALFLKHRDLQVFLSPAHYAPRFSPCRTIVIVHDLSFFYYPQDFLKRDLHKLQHWTAYSIKKAAKVIAVSQKTKSDLMFLYGLPSNKIEVIYNGFTASGLNSGRVTNLTVKKPYFLYIGTLQPRKNIINLILAFEKLLQKNQHYYLYIVGKSGWLYEDIFKLVKKKKLDERIVFNGYVNEAEKWQLLRGATGLVVPGFYEGFGLPILEGFAAGIPVLAASSGALPEIGGEACLYFNPTKVEEIEKAMLAVIAGEAKKLKDKGRIRLKQFSWQKTAAQILRVCK